MTERSPRGTKRRDVGAAGEASQRDYAQRRANDKLWSGNDRSRNYLVRDYSTRELRPVEVMLLVRYREALSGRVLELGCGAGRVIGYLAELASTAHGLDISPAMIEYCRRTYPSATFSEGDLRDVSAFEPASFDVVVAPWNVIDVLGDEERRALLDEIHCVLAPDGLLLMSTHNRDHAPRRGKSLQLRGRSLLRAAIAHARSPLRAAITLARMPRWLRNRRRLLPLERNEPGYAVLNDVSHDFAALHYYIWRGAQEQQFAEHGFELLECLDLDGHRVDSDDDAPDCPELHYVARRRPTVGERV